jgi:hypothetical protein
MNQVDLHNNIRVSVALEPQTIDADTTTVGEIIDRQGFASLEFVVFAGTLADGTFTAALTEGDADDLSDGTTVAAGDLLGSLPVVDESGEIKRVGYRGTKRYVRLSVVSTSTTDGGPLGATAVQSGARNNPVT